MAKYQEWLEPDGLTLLRGYARRGLTDEEIAAKCGVTRSTLSDWKSRFPDISDALKKGKDVVDDEIEQALYNKALSGDCTAMIFWLKNRRPEAWRDKQEIKTDNEVRYVFDDLEGDIMG